MELLLQHCQAAMETHGGLLMTLFIGGLVGSFSHCAGMCGPFALAQSLSAGSAPGGDPLLARVRGAALLPYHAGRISTYVMLGVLAATASGYFVFESAAKLLPAVLLSAAGILFLGAAIPSLKVRFLPAGLRRRVYQLGEALGRAAKPLLRGRSWVHRYALGLTLGLLPCGLVAAALLAVAATASGPAAALGMLAFGIGTIPALFAVSLVGPLARARWPVNTVTLTRGLLAFNSVSLFAISGGLLL